MEISQDLVAESSADMSDVAPCVAFSQGEDQGAEERPGALRRREPGNYYLLSLRRLDLQPIAGPASRRVRAVGALRHDAFQILSFGLREEFLTIPFAARAEVCGEVEPPSAASFGQG